MTAEVIVQLTMSLGVIPGLFIWLLFDTRKEHKEQIQESKERERQLMAHIEKSDENQREIVTTLKLMQRDIEELKRERD